MIAIRDKKVKDIALDIPEQTITRGPSDAEVLVLGWGSTYGAIENAVKDLLAEGVSVSHIHLKYLNPFPRNLEYLLKGFGKVIIPEMNQGQLSTLIRDHFLIDTLPVNKVKGLPFTVEEIKEAILKHSDYVSTHA